MQKILAQRISATFSCNCAKNGAKLGTNEADTIKIKNRHGGISKI